MSLKSLIGSAAARIAARLSGRTPVFYTADVLLFAYDRNRVPHVLLIERGRNPHKGKLALPGGHVNPDETAVQAARREAIEETGLDLTRVRLDRVGIYDEPGRDPRGRYLSVAVTAVLPEMPAPVAGDDATAAAWVPLQVALKAAERGRLAFDHDRILHHAIAVTRVR